MWRQVGVLFWYLSKHTWKKKPNLNQKGRRRWSGVGGNGFCYHDELNKLKAEREKRCGRTYTGMQCFIRINTTKIEGKFEYIKMHLHDHNRNKVFSCYRKGRPLLFIISKWRHVNQAFQQTWVHLGSTLWGTAAAHTKHAKCGLPRCTPHFTPVAGITEGCLTVPRGTLQPPAVCSVEQRFWGSASITFSQLLSLLLFLAVY